MNINDKLKDIRIKLNLTQEDFAESIGVTRETVSCYENGTRKPSIEIVKSISEIYNISYEEICEDLAKEKRKSKAGFKYLLITLLISLILVITMLLIHFVNINNKYGYNIYNDRLKVQNCSDICIVKVNYLEEDNKSEKIYNVSCIEYLKNTSFNKYDLNKVIFNSSLIKLNKTYIYLIFGEIKSENNIEEIDVKYLCDITIEDKPFIIELKDYNESFSYDNQIGNCKNTIDYYVNLIKEQKK